MLGREGTEKQCRENEFGLFKVAYWVEVPAGVELRAMRSLPVKRLWE